MHITPLIVLAELARVGLSAYTIYDTYDATNWLQKFMFETVSRPMIDRIAN